MMLTHYPRILVGVLLTLSLSNFATEAKAAPRCLFGKTF